MLDIILSLTAIAVTIFFIAVATQPSDFRDSRHSAWQRDQYDKINLSMQALPNNVLKENND
ncbi:MAG: hypothetical protein Q7T40_00175 [Methylobacter sp.]|nr:hypothetical protein [Methylobacter sp.]